MSEYKGIVGELKLLGPDKVKSWQTNLPFVLNLMSNLNIKFVTFSVILCFLIPFEYYRCNLYVLFILELHCFLKYL